MNTPYVLRKKLDEGIWLHASDNDNIVIELNQGRINITTRLSGLKLSEIWSEMDTDENIVTKNIQLMKTKYLTPPIFVM